MQQQMFVQLLSNISQVFLFKRKEFNGYWNVLKNNYASIWGCILNLFRFLKHVAIDTNQLCEQMLMAYINNSINLNIMVETSSFIYIDTCKSVCV